MIQTLNRAQHKASTLHKPSLSPEHSLQDRYLMTYCSSGYLHQFQPTQLLSPHPPLQLSIIPSFTAAINGSIKSRPRTILNIHSQTNSVFLLLFQPSATVITSSASLSMGVLMTMASWAWGQLEPPAFILLPVPQDSVRWHWTPQDLVRPSLSEPGCHWKCNHLQISGSSASLIPAQM